MSPTLTRGSTSSVEATRLAERDIVDRPADDVIEVSVFGRGFGESIVLHMGLQQWVVVDSFTTLSGVPVALEYLRRIKVKSSKICALVLTHYDADHYLGFADLFDACGGNVRFCTTEATSIDVLKMLVKRDRSRRMSGELYDLVRAADHKGLHRPLSAGHDPYELLGGARLTAMSPVDLAASTSRRQLMRLLESEAPQEQVKEALKKKNLCSIALRGSVGNASFLLGGDVLRHRRFGWHAILNMPDATNGSPAAFVKAPHHGAKSGHDDAMWSELVGPNPSVGVAPFSHGRTRLPTATDLARLSSLAHRVDVAAQHPSSKSLPGGIDLQMGDEIGLVRARRPIGRGRWDIQVFGAAYRHK